ncbi:MAG: transporter substrate-binding domain-containing protein [Sedimenticola sp.]|nr:transporter substrate-binding domain-containing protein [Sedimenticola sp.]
MGPAQQSVLTWRREIWLIWLAVLVCSGTLPSLAQASNDQQPPSSAIKLVTSHLVPYSIQEGREQGFMVDLVREIERRIGTNRPVLFLPWPRAIRNTRLSTNHIIFPLTRTPEREAHFDWAIKVAPIHLVFVTLDGQVLNLEQARLLPAIAVQQNTPFEQYLRQEGFNNLIVTTSAASIQVRMLQAGRVNAWFTAKDLASYSMKELFVQGPITYSAPITSGHVYIALSKRFPRSLKTLYQQTFEAMQADGTYQQIMSRYIRN